LAYSDAARPIGEVRAFLPGDVAVVKAVGIADRTSLAQLGVHRGIFLRAGGFCHKGPCSSRPDLAYSTLPHPYAFIASSVFQDTSPGVVMSKLTPEDILSTARRVGWDISAERAQQIAATASPAVEKFAEARKHLNFDHDTLTLQAAREMTKVQPDGKGR